MIQKKWFIIAAAAAGLMLLLVTASFVIGIVGLGQGSAPETPTDTITVYGQGVVTAAPDIAYITLGYQNSAERPQAAQAANAETMAQIVAAVREAGVLEADIGSAQVNMYEEYNYGEGPGEQSYCASSTINVTVRDVSRATNVVSAACAAGANISYGITYDLINRQDEYAGALEIARQRADEKAAELSAALGREIAGIASAEEHGAADYGGDCYGYGCADTLLTDYASGGGINGGIKVSAVIYVTYRLE